MTERDGDPFSGLPHTEVDAFSEAQLAALLSLNLDPSAVETVNYPLIGTEAAPRGDGWMTLTGVTHYRCPLVLVDGVERMILPNGELFAAKGVSLR